MIFTTLREARDADYTHYKTLKTGVPLGVLTPLPHCPALYELQCKWRLQDDPLIHAMSENANYASADDHLIDIERQFQEEAKLGWMAEVSDEVFQNQFGADSAVSALAVLLEASKQRILHDGSHVTRVNHRIKCRDKQRLPTLKEKRLLLNEAREKNSFCFSLLGDAGKAHRRVKVDEREWGFMGCRTRPGFVWYNTVGTFGMGSACYWWARTAAGIIRCTYALLGPLNPLEILLFADDSEFLMVDKSERRSILRAVVAMAALGWPWKWSKFRGGYSVDWIGYHINYREYAVGISATRSAWVVAWITRLLQDRKVQTTEMRCGLGRLSFTVIALHYEKPLLGPIYVWVSTIVRAGLQWAEIPLAILTIFQWLKTRLETHGGNMQVVHRPHKSPTVEWFRTDARAEAGRAYVGGWEVTNPAGDNHPIGECRWFATEITKAQAPWVWAKSGDPQRVIAALELVGTLLGITLFDGDATRRGSTSCSIGASTDNKGNSYIINKMCSTKWPMIPLLLELSEQLRVRDAELHLSWLPRELNTEADALSNLVFTGFDESKRINCDFGPLKWLVLAEVMKSSEDLYHQVCQQREETKRRKGPPPNIRKLAGNKRLKWTDPW